MQKEEMKENKFAVKNRDKQKKEQSSVKKLEDSKLKVKVPRYKPKWLRGVPGG
jgi:hypothetical protein